MYVGSWEPLTYDVNVGHVAPLVGIIAAFALGDGQELDADVRPARLGRDHAVERGADADAELVALVVVDAHAAHQPLQRIDADVDGATQPCTKPMHKHVNNGSRLLTDQLYVLISIHTVLVLMTWEHGLVRMCKQGLVGRLVHVIHV